MTDKRMENKTFRVTTSYQTTDKKETVTCGLILNALNISLKELAVSFGVENETSNGEKSKFVINVSGVDANEVKQNTIESILISHKIWIFNDQAY